MTKDEKMLYKDQGGSDAVKRLLKKPKNKSQQEFETMLKHQKLLRMNYESAKKRFFEAKDALNEVELELRDHPYWVQYLLNMKNM
jgi:hypothetical protein